MITRPRFNALAAASAFTPRVAPGNPRKIDDRDRASPDSPLPAG